MGTTWMDREAVVDQTEMKLASRKTHVADHIDSGPFWAVITERRQQF